MLVSSLEIRRGPPAGRALRCGARATWRAWARCPKF